VPILQHAGHMHYLAGDQPRISDGAHPAELARRYPEARLICGHIRGGADRGGWGDLPPNDLIEISRMDSVLANEIGPLIANLGADRVVFGTGMPSNVPDPTLLKMEVLAATEAEKEKIYGRNVARLLREEV